MNVVRVLVKAWDGNDTVCILLEGVQVVEAGHGGECAKIEAKLGRPRIAGGIVASSLSIDVYIYEEEKRSKKE